LGALLIGLPTAVLAHALTYGQGHVLGGSHHENVLQLTLALGAVAAAAAAALTLASARTAQNGSILASRIAAYLPGWAGLAISAAAWFGLIESLESEHQVPALLILVAIAATAWLVRSLTRAALGALAQIAFAIFAVPIAPRSVFTATQTVAPILVRSRIVGRRRFARPPPFFA
jgi:hypothetical protein